MPTNMAKYGTSMNTTDVWRAMTLPARVDMTLGLLLAMFMLYRRSRDCKDVEIVSVAYSKEREGKIILNRKHIGIVIATLFTLVT